MKEDSAKKKRLQKEEERVGSRYIGKT
jgi:hypothetical protein